MTDLDNRTPLVADERVALRRPPDSEAWAGEPVVFLPFTVADPMPRKRRWWEPRPPKPTEADVQFAADQVAIRAASWPTSRRIAVGQPKSSAKTPTSVCLAGAFGAARGGGTVVWDASEARGSLAARTVGSGRIDLADLVDRHDAFTTAAAIGRAVAVQPSNVHVLAGTRERSLDADGVAAVTRVLDPYYAIQVADTGANAVHSPTFQKVLDLADVLVVPTTLAADSLNRAAELVFTLSRTRLAGHILVIVSRFGSQATVADARATLTRAGAVDLLEVPFDSHIAEGGPIDWARLSGPSQQAWTRAAAALLPMMEGPTP